MKQAALNTLNIELLAPTCSQQYLKQWHLKHSKTTEISNTLMHFSNPFQQCEESTKGESCSVRVSQGCRCDVFSQGGFTKSDCVAKILNPNRVHLELPADFEAQKKVNLEAGIPKQMC